MSFREHALCSALFPQPTMLACCSVYCTEGHKCGIVSQALGSTNPQGSKMKLFATQGNNSESQKFGGENLKTLALGELFLCWMKLLFHSL